MDNRIHATSDAKGIIAYSKSLLLGLRDEGLLSKDGVEKELLYFENILKSFEGLENSILRTEFNTESIKSKSKVILGFILISLWGTANFIFAASEKIKVDTPFSFMIPVMMLFFVILVYFAIKRFYAILTDAKKLVEVYSISLKSISLRIGLALLSIVVLIFIDLMQ